MRFSMISTNITPPPGFPLGGYLQRYLKDNAARGALDELKATVVVIDEGEGLALVSLDLIGLEDDLYEATQNTFRRAGYKALILAGTHTHSGPETIAKYPFFKPFVKGYLEKIREYKQFLIQRLKVLVEEIPEPRNVDVRISKCEVKDVCSSRIALSEFFDNEASVILFDRDALIVYQCHPTVLGPDNMFYSGDLFFGIRSALSPMRVALFNGAAGDLSTRFLRKSRTYDEVKRLGKLVAESLLPAIEVSKRAEGEVESYKITVSAKRKSASDLEEARKFLIKRLSSLKERLRKEENPGMRRKLENDVEITEYLLKTLEEIAKELESLPKVLKIEVLVVEIGNIRMLALPFELSSILGWRLKRDVNALVIGYANGYLGYAVDERLYRTMEYESLVSLLKPGEAEMLVDQLINELR